VRKQKTDRQDAQLILKVMLKDDFPRIWVPSWENRDLRQLLWHRHRMVQARSRPLAPKSLVNTLHLAASHNFTTLNKRNQLPRLEFGRLQEGPSVRWQPGVHGIRACGPMLILALLSLAQAPLATASSQIPQAEDQASGIPKFHAHWRRVLVETEVWKAVVDKNGDTPWDPVESLNKLTGTSVGRIVGHLPTPAHDLAIKDFHV